MVAYDPNSPHWQTHSRLETFILCYFYWGYVDSRFGHLLEEMVKEAKPSDCTKSCIRLDWR
jgi:hypothetical protein